MLLRMHEEAFRQLGGVPEDKLIFGTDCNDRVGQGDACSGARCIAVLRRLSPSPAALRKIFSENAVRPLNIPL